MRDVMMRWRKKEETNKQMNDQTKNDETSNFVHELITHPNRMEEFLNNYSGKVTKCIDIFLSCMVLDLDHGFGFGSWLRGIIITFTLVSVIFCWDEEHPPLRHKPTPATRCRDSN